MFLVNSCLGLFSAALSGSKCLTLRLLRAILLPKLRMQFAEFLNEGFPAHLRILSPPTCVGFGTGAYRLVRSFSRQCSTTEFVHLRRVSLSVGSRPYKGDLPPLQPTAFDTPFQPRAQSPCCVTPSSINFMQYRNFRLLSIAYACCLGLGPDLP